MFVVTDIDDCILLTGIASPINFTDSCQFKTERFQPMAMATTPSGNEAS